MRVKSPQWNKKHVLITLLSITSILLFFNCRRVSDSVSTTPTVAETVKITNQRGRVCSEKEKLWQNQIMSAARARGCASKDAPILRIVHLHFPHAQIFLDIGSNKGYAAAEWYELWNPEMDITRVDLKSKYQALPQELIQAGYFSECGGCNECRDRIQSLISTRIQRACTPKAGTTTSGAQKTKELKDATDSLCNNLLERYSPIRVYSFDSNPDMVKGLTQGILFLQSSTSTKEVSGKVDELIKPEIKLKIKEQFSSNLSKFWKVENIAVTTTNHEKEVSVVLNEGELGRLNQIPVPSARIDDERSATFWVKIAKTNPKLTSAKAESIDEICSRLNLNHVDFLKIDVEGHDADVLQGASKLIENHLVVVIKFEYGTIWSLDQRPPRMLKTVIENFDRFGYSCYFEGKNGVLKLTNNCWSEDMETKFWSNVWCFSMESREGQAISHALDNFSVIFW